MDVTDITSHLDRLDHDVDALEEALKPLMQNLGEVAASLPLLEKAKLYILATYSIESLLFSSLQLSGHDGKNHPVFKELVRVRHYYEKIKAAEELVEAPNKTLDTQAAIRFIKAGVTPSDTELKNKLAEQLAKEKVKAAMKARQKQVQPVAEQSG